MSSFKILYRDGIIGEPGTSYGTSSIGLVVPELCKKLWEYYDEMGVNSYQTDEENTLDSVRWELNGSWYTTSQIERIKKIKVFL
jgi:hypothetical protein